MNTEKKHYATSLDLTAKIITGALVAMMICFLVVAFYAFGMEEGTITFKVGYPWLLPAGIMLLVLLFCYCFRVTGYEVDGDSIKIHRPLGSLLIGFSRIREVVIPMESDMRRTYRLFGNGGVFGYFGIFRNAVFGNMHWYATRNSNWIIVEDSNRRKLVLTPNDLGMAENIRDGVKRARPE